MEITTCVKHRNALRIIIPMGVKNALGLGTKTRIYWQLIAPGVVTIQNLEDVITRGQKTVRPPPEMLPIQQPTNIEIIQAMANA